MKDNKNCKKCLHGKPRQGAVYCSLKGRLLLSNKAEDCDDYGDNYDIRSLKKRGKYEEESKYVSDTF